MTERSRLSLLALFFAACAAYGSFVPLVWRRVSWTEGLERFARMPFRPFDHFNTGDFYTNILVFLPIAFFAAGAVATSRRGLTPGTAFRVVAAAALYSVFLELGQTYIVARTPSWSDIVAQACGAAAGVAVWAITGPRLLAAVASPMRAKGIEVRSDRLLALYAAGWLILSALPVFFPRLAHPQLDLWRAQLDLSPLTLLGPLLAAGLAAVPLGAFAARFARRNHAAWRAIAALVLGPAVLIGADAVRQVQFLPADGHRASSLLGYSVGWLFACPLGDPLRARLASHRLLATSAGMTLMSAFLLLHYWAPFNFGVRPATLDYRIRVLYERAPFHRYYWTPPLIALGEAMTLLMLGGLLAALLRFGRWRFSVAAATAATGIVFATIEWGQLYLPGRRADPTDVMIALVGAFMGATIARVLEASPPSPPAGS